MKNKKLLKLLASLAMGSVMAVSTFGMVACGGGDKDKDKDEHKCQHVCDVDGKCKDPDCEDEACADKCPGHNSDHSSHTGWGNWIDDTVNNNHYRVCAVDGCNEKQTGNHADSNNDNKCDDCGHDMSSGGPTVTPETSDGYKAFVEAAGNNLVYSNSFDTEAAVPFGKENATSENGAKVYGDIKDKTDYVTGGTVSIKNGDLAIEDTEESNTILGNIFLDNALTSGKVTVRIEYKVDTVTNSWTQLFLCNDEGKELIALRTDGGKVKYRIAESSAVYGSGVSYSANTTITVELKLDLMSGTFEVWAASGSESLTDITATSNNTFTANAENFANIKFGTATKTRSIYVSNVAVKYEGASLQEVKAIYDAKVSDYHTKILAGCTVDAYKPTVNEKKNAYDNASQAAQSIADVKTAYDTYVSEMLTLLQTYGADIVKGAYSPDNYTTEKDAYDAIITKVTEDLAAATTIDQALELITAAEKKIETELHDDSHYAKADVTVTVKAKSDSDSWQDIGTFTVKSGESIAYTEIVKNLNIPEGYVLEGLYLEEALTTKIGDQYTAKTANQPDTDTIYAKLDIKPAPKSSSWNVTCASNQPSITGTEGGLTVEFVDKNGGTSSGNASDFKFDGAAAKLTLTLTDLQKGQTIKVKVSGYSGSSDSSAPGGYKDVDLSVTTATNAVAAAGNAEGNKVTFPGTATKNDLASGEFVYTVNEDGTVTLVLQRVAGNTTRLVSLEITVE